MTEATSAKDTLSTQGKHCSEKCRLSILNRNRVEDVYFLIMSILIAILTTLYEKMIFIAPLLGVIM